MAHTIRVRILNREYSLRVKKADEALTRDLVAYIDERIREFRRAHPEQPELTASIITSLALAEELFEARDELARVRSEYDEAIGEMTRLLGEATAVNGSPQAP